MGDHVFVCYARKDEEFVLQLTKTLKHQGVHIWLDQARFEGGEDWNRSIETAIYDYAKFLIVLSRAAVDSREVQGELRLALSENIAIIPVIYRLCRHTRQLLLHR